VQGDRTVGITEIPNDALWMDCPRLRIPSRSQQGHNAVEASRRSGMVARGSGVVLAAILLLRCPIRKSHQGDANLDLAAHIATKLNRSHLLVGKQSLILPCLGRTEIDLQATGPQSITVEDSMSMVHASRGD